jgi:broad specificity phosphatase PhoE
LQRKVKEEEDMTMLIRRTTTQQAQRYAPLIVGKRNQGTAAAAIARHCNEQTALIKSYHHEESPRTTTPHFNSTIHLNTPTKDYFSSLSLKHDDDDNYYFEAHSEALFSALNSHVERRHSTYNEANAEEVQRHLQPQRPLAVAYDMDLVEASYAVRDYETYDKILILMRHGEAKHNTFEREYAQSKGVPREKANDDENYPVDPMLTGKGCGQMLNVSRRTATFFNKTTGLQPNLVVVSPLRRAIQSAIISFPTYTPQASLLDTPSWICHPSCMELANGNKSEFVSSVKDLKETFPGIDFNLFEDYLIDGNVDELNGKAKVPLFESKLDLMERTDEFLSWIKEREERVIVVSSHATWLQSLCAFSLQYESESSKGLEPFLFKKGELRSVGIKFQ